MHIRLALIGIVLIFACGILACTLWIVLPFVPGLDSCLLSTDATPQESAEIRTRYQEFYALNRSGNYEQAYQYTSTSYRTQNSFEDYKEQADRVFLMDWGVELRPDSDISVCGDHALLHIVKNEGIWDIAGTFKFVKQDGQWYVDGLDYILD